MKARRLGTAIFVLMLGLQAQPLGAQELPPTPPRNQWFAYNEKGHFGNGPHVRIDKDCLDLSANQRVACSLAKFRAKPFVVIAFVDSGINPYHEDFRAPEFVHHPSTYIEGYPKDATALQLDLATADKRGYAAARERDLEEWTRAGAGKLHWFPGTRVIGGISMGSGGTSTPEFQELPILDDQGHGTGVASVGAGQYFGSNPEALIVMVEGLGGDSLAWAASQKWIDIVSNSWGNIANLPLGSQEPSREATRRGQTIAFAAGNGATNTNSSTVFPPDGPVEDPCKCKTPDSNPSLTSPYGGPSWVLTVGAVSPINGQAHWWHSIPVDVSSFGSKWRSAAAFGIKADVKDETGTRDFGGTSCATPVTAGVLSLLILEAREVFNDTMAGQRPDQVVAKAAGGAKLPKAGPLEDGALTRLEAETIVQKTAFPVDADPEKITWDYAVRPTTPLYFIYQGYGVVDRTSKALALDVLMGREELPVRDDVDGWIAAVDMLRNAVWGAP